MTRSWLLLALAVISEVAGTLALRAALDHPAWALLVVLGYTGALVALGAVLRSGMGIAVVYGVWAATGVALTAVLAAFIFDEQLNATVAAGIALIIAGVVIVQIGSQHANRPPRLGATR